MFLPSIGVDLLHLPRLRTLLARRPLARFAARILTPTELQTFHSKFPPTAPSRLQSSVEDSAALRWLGVRWAAKEAAFKAANPSRRLMWKEVEIGYREGGQPFLRLFAPGGMAEGEGVGEGGLSISHDGEYVVAMAVIANKA